MFVWFGVPLAMLAGVLAATFVPRGYTLLGSAVVGMAVYLLGVAAIYAVATAFEVRAYMVNGGYVLSLVPGLSTLPERLPWAMPWVVPTVCLMGGVLAIAAVHRRRGPVVRRLLYAGMLVSMAMALLPLLFSVFVLLVLAPLVLGMLLFMVLFNPRLREVKGEG